MTSEEIIERLLRQKKISPKEALIMLKDIAKIAVTGDYDYQPENYKIATMYGVSTPTVYGSSGFYSNTDLLTSASSNNYDLRSK